ncbi:hypothetical protein G9A89_014189 [Geosiphon pyriformis]|nr:hypothetical protein G9A89_014189 [Geosiphon pyriformis]
MYNKSKPFFNYEATIGSVIAVIKKTIKVSGFEGGFKAVVSRKKRKEGVLAESIDNKEVAAETSGAYSWGFETGDTTESESIDMEEECLVEETSVDYGKSGAFTKRDSNQTLKGLCIKTKKVLGKPLGVIDYSTVNTDDNVLDNFFFFLLPLPIKLTIQVPVCKFFALNINLVAITGKSSQEKLSFIKKIFLSVNGFGEAFTPSKFGGIICVTFTLEKAMMAAGKLANNHGVVINTNLKRSVNNHTNQAIVLKKIPVGTSIETVRMTVSEFGKIKMIKMQLVIIELEDQDQANLLVTEWSILIGKDVVRVARADIDKQTVLLYTLPVGTTAYNLWDFIGSVSEKTCMINHNSVNYNCACCTIVCFGSEIDMTWAMANTPVIKRIGFCWLDLVTPLCSACNSLGHSLLVCKSAAASLSPKSKKAPLSAQDRFRLAKIYEKKSAPIFRPLVFGGKSWASVVGSPLFLAPSGSLFTFGSTSNGKPLFHINGVLEKRLNSIENSLISLVEQIGELAKKLDSLVLAVLQPSSGCQLLNQGEDIVMGVGSSEATSGKTVITLNLLTSPHVIKLENMLEGLSKSVLILSAHFDSLALVEGANLQPPSQ